MMWYTATDSNELSKTAYATEWQDTRRIKMWVTARSRMNHEPHFKSFERKTEAEKHHQRDVAILSKKKGLVLKPQDIEADVVLAGLRIKCKEIYRIEYTNPLQDGYLVYGKIVPEPKKGGKR
jgi:hypothetical protein